MTSVKGVYAVGDVNGKSIYAHAASAQALAAVNHILGITETMQTERVPLTLYTDPEIAQIGRTEQQLAAEGTEYKVNEFPLSANGKALTEGSRKGSSESYLSQNTARFWVFRLLPTMPLT